MIAMQYKITLPEDYDMNIIYRRVSENGYKTDDFNDLIFKAYLISESTDSPHSFNEYSPLYLWKSHEGMNQFIFQGFYDHIIKSFGWQKIQVGIPIKYDFTEDFEQSQFVLEYKKDISPAKQMDSADFTLSSDLCTGKMIIYNPDYWIITEYYFFKSAPDNIGRGKIYRLLHLSR